MTAPLPALVALRDAVGASTGPDREIDAQIMFDLFAKPVGRKSDGGPTGYLWPEDNPSWSFGIRFPGKDRDWFKKHSREPDDETLLIWRDDAWVLMNALRIPRLTASLDASERLRMALLPDWSVHIDQADNRDWWVELREGYATSFQHTVRAHHPVESIARTLAVLNALISQAEAKAQEERE